MFLLDNDFRLCMEAANALERDWFASGGGVGWETDVVRHFSLASQQMLGMLGELAGRVEEHIDTAHRTGDLFQEVTLRVRFAVRHLIADQPAEAEADIAGALASWQPSAETFGNQRAWALWSRTRVVLYTREFGRLEEAVGDEWQRMRRALIGRVPALKVEWYHAYGTYLIARSIDARVFNRASEHAALCKQALKLAAEVGRMQFPAAPAVARLLEAGVACARGGDVIGPLKIALEAATAREFLVFTPFLKLRLGEAIGGDEGAELVASGTKEAASQGWKIPAQGAEMAIPVGDGVH
jgi:hypothetical protein